MSFSILIKNMLPLVEGVMVDDHIRKKNITLDFRLGIQRGIPLCSHYKNMVVVSEIP
jgi:hypothetical protein